MPTFLVLSDIHASDEDPSSSKAPSYVSSFNSAAAAKTDPIADLVRLCTESDISPDYLLCAGDITNRSSPPSFTYVWTKLNDAAKAINARLIATVGNHDLDSRYQSNKQDPRGYAMSLRPWIPVDKRINYLEYWAQHFTLLQEPDCNIVVLNTAAYHGGGEDVKKEIEHGRISDITIDLIRSAIAGAEPRDTNILLCHHHPIGTEQSDKNLDGATRGGDKLVGLLNESSHPWLIIHGHKHVPELFYGQGGANSPVVLACASFSAQVNADAQNKNPNQVHLVSTDPVQASALSLACAGAVKSWTWQPGVGWVKAYGKLGMPHVSGFGYRSSISQLAKNLDAYISGRSESYLNWSETLRQFPAISHLVPVDFVTFKKSLANLKLTILTSDDGEMAQVGRTT